MENRRPTLPELTSLRFFAAILVVLGHRAPLTNVAWPKAQFSPSNIWANAEPSLDFFFMLSGFILAYTYANASGGFRGTLRSYYVSRVARIYPVYLLSLVLGVGLISTAPDLPFVHSAFYKLQTAATPVALQAWIPLSNYWNGPSWSLSVEAFFYLLFPFLVLRLSRVSPRKLVTIAVLFWGAMVALAVGSVVVSLALAHLLGSRFGHDSFVIQSLNGDNFARGYFLVRNPAMCLPEFAIGVIAGLLFLRRGDQPAARLVGTPPKAMAKIVGVAALLIWSYDFPTPGQISLLKLLVVPLFAVIIYCVACDSAGTSRRLLALPALMVLGEASYSMYILHVPIWNLLYDRLAGGIWGRHILQSWWLYIAYILTVIGLSVFSHLVFEHPVRVAIRARFGGRAAPGALARAKPQIAVGQGDAR
jgi:peptidoglycan/LPS O-acetylase OafA/YrhL